MRKGRTLALTLVALTTATAVALAAGDVQRITNHQGAFTTAASGRHAATTPLNDSQDAGLVAISDSFSKYSKSPYWAWTEANVNGPSYSGYAEVWTAAPFTPLADHAATKLEVAAIWSSGPNGLVLSLDKDAGGVPGSVIKAWKLTNLPQSLCCSVESVSDKGGLQLKAGTQYWVVLTTDAAEAGTSAGWALSELGQRRGATLAQYCSDDRGGSCASYGLQNDTWIAFHSLYGVAFAVLGK
ncbi:MAG: choice-of-anchor R domain-containing protein [Candidatus Cybelea sp.]|jgi:hypothetical protein